MSSLGTSTQSIDVKGPHPALDRGLDVIQATALNIANMVGIGPFITIPLFLAAMGGPQAMIAWLIAAVLVLCDGLVWSELGAALPASGGSYHFLRQIFGVWRWGRIMPFLFIWQFLISGTMELASGYIGAMDYVKYALPGLEPALLRWHIPGGMGVVAAGGVVIVTLLLCWRIRIVGWLAVVMCVGTLVTMFLVIGAGLRHFDAMLLRVPPGAFHVHLAWILGLGGAMRIAVYDYLGYYNICYLGDEVKQPARTIPRAVIWSVLIIATLYVTMNICIIAVVPWEEAIKSSNIAATFMEKLYGRPIAVAFTALIIWTATASCFAMTLGYSRIPYAAAREGDFFRVFGRVSPREKLPLISLLTVSGLTAIFCFLPLQQVIDVAVTVRILIQFVGQITALHVLRTTRPDVTLPFRMWLYPVPSIIAFVGWIFMWATSGWVLVAEGVGVIVAGIAVFVVWRALFPSSPTSTRETEASA